MGNRYTGMHGVHSCPGGMGGISVQLWTPTVTQRWEGGLSIFDFRGDILKLPVIPEFLRISNG